MPGRLSGVWSAETDRSIDASAEAAMTLVANPVVRLAAIWAHFSFWAVIKTLPAHRANISAKVS